jgi:microcystin-dependent protein
MPLEDLVGAKYIDDLNENWPLGSDYPDAGDDHIRGIKNVLKRTFPYVTGPVNMTQDQLNGGSIPVGTRMVFYQAAAPTGWARVPDINTTRMLRVVAATSAGGNVGGSDDPVLMNKVPAHTHAVSGATGSSTAAHTHTATVTIASGGAHQHDINYRNGTEDGDSNTCYADLKGCQGFDSIAKTVSSGEHTHTGTVTVQDSSAAHTHTLAVNCAENASSANWVPRYADVIICEKTG